MATSHHQAVFCWILGHFVLENAAASGHEIHGFLFRLGLGFIEAWFRNQVGLFLRVVHCIFSTGSEFLEAWFVVRGVRRWRAPSGHGSSSYWSNSTELPATSPCFNCFFATSPLLITSDPHLSPHPVWKSWHSTRVWWDVGCVGDLPPPFHRRLSQDILQYTGKPRILGTGLGFWSASFEGYVLDLGYAREEATASNAMSSESPYFKKQPISRNKRAQRLEPKKVLRKPVLGHVTGKVTKKIMKTKRVPIV